MGKILSKWRKFNFFVSVFISQSKDNFDSINRVSYYKLGAKILECHLLRKKNTHVEEKLTPFYSEVNMKLFSSIIYMVDMAFYNKKIY